MSGERAALLADIRAAAESGARTALESERQRCESCVNFAESGTKEAAAHAEDHNYIRRFFIPFVKKNEARALNFASLIFWVLLALAVILFVTEVRPLAAFILNTPQAGGK